MTMQPFIPQDLPLQDLEWRKLVSLVGKANSCLARYDGMLQTLPNPAVLLSPITANEAVLSSKIEGTQATLDEVFKADAGIVIPERRRGDIEEISNYRSAVQLAEEAMQERPLSLSLVKQIHQRLMQGVRGRDKNPGAFRDDQNWIGRRGDTIEQARFIPPRPAVMQASLQNLEEYLIRTDEDPLLMTCLAHAQFEIIHPFKDGNGRIGRMLIPLILFQHKILSSPMFYMSEFLESNRNAYYDHLLGITDRNDWHHWIEFFMNGLIQQAESNLQRVQAIRDLYETMQARVVEITHSQFSHQTVDCLFSNPIISGPNFARLVGFNTRVTANGMLRQLFEAGIVTKIKEGAGRSPAIYAVPSLINITEGKQVFGPPQQNQ